METGQLCCYDDVIDQEIAVKTRIQKIRHQYGT